MSLSVSMIAPRPIDKWPNSFQCEASSWQSTNYDNKFGFDFRQPNDLAKKSHVEDLSKK